MGQYIKALLALVVSRFALPALRGDTSAIGGNVNAHHHARGILLAVAAAIEGWGAWFLVHIQVINYFMQFSVFAVALITGLVGLRKVLKKR